MMNLFSKQNRVAESDENGVVRGKTNRIVGKAGESKKMRECENGIYWSNVSGTAYLGSSCRTLAVRCAIRVLSGLET